MTCSFVLDFINVGGLQIIGRADLIVNRDGENVIIDFKTGEKDKKKIEQARMQLCLYALCMKDYDLSQGEVYFLSDGSKERFMITDYDKKEMEQLLLNMEKYLRNDELVCNNNPKDKNYHCQNCELASNRICPFMKLQKKKFSRKGKEIVIDDDLNIALESEPQFNL